ncbi:polyprenol monophosphomannose synthase [uncultured Aeromicrobium sp.]|uniref:polyprenol monophosphomannose synthase n=1 Tax=uncultured Aeromicrobium sp. TaxID=337820 RepID=UPI0025F18D2F|nr:polyprenol monophosphomannose synthase [uncultured Aeromicrobium sp.]
MDTPAEQKALVIVPTYNERDSIVATLHDILAASDADVLVVDDASPDGTAQRARELANPRVHVLDRPGKLGLGTAYVDGFGWGLERGYGVLVEMDADGSHPADRLQALIDVVRGGEADLAIGSRWVRGGSVIDWPRHREALSRGANAYARVMLGLSVHDATAGFRAFSAELLRRFDLAGVHSQGYCFQIDMTVRARDLGARIVELPIAFREREHGVSKMSVSIILEAMLRVTWWGLRRLTGRRLQEPASA